MDHQKPLNRLCSLTIALSFLIAVASLCTSAATTFGQAPSPTPEGSPKPAAAKLSTVPEKISDWRSDDYYRARQGGDPRLKEAATYLGTRFQKSVPAAKDAAAMLLTRMLTGEVPEWAKPAVTPKPKPNPSPSAGSSDSESSSSESSSSESSSSESSSSESSSSEGSSSDSSSESGSGGLRPAKPLDAETIAALVNALAALAGPKAQASLQGILTGSVASDSDAVAVESLLAMLLSKPSKDNDRIVFELLTTPEKYRAAAAAATTGNPGSSSSESSSYESSSYESSSSDSSRLPRGKLNTAQLQAKAAQVVQESAPEAFRLKLAQYFNYASAPAAHRTLLKPVLLAQHPQNLSAQLLLYSSPVLEQADKQAKADLDVFFVKYGSDALALLLRVPFECKVASQAKRPNPSESGGYGSSSSEGSSSEESSSSSDQMRPPVAGPGQTKKPGMGPFGTPDGDLPYRMVQQLWAPTFTASVEGQLATSKSLEESALPILVASTIPTDKMRASLVQLFTRHWKSGPQSLIDHGIGEDLFSDPGFLVVMKSMPRRDPPVQVPRKTNTRKRGNRGSSESSSSNESKEVERPDFAWMDATEHLIRSMCSQFEAAGKNRTGSADPAAARPVELVPPNVSVTSEYHFDWPGSLANAKKLPAIATDPMTVHYVCFEGEATPMRVLEFFKLKVGASIEHTASSGYWTESWRAIPQGARRRSVDVLIAKKGAAAKPAGGSDSEQPASSSSSSERSGGGKTLPDKLTPANLVVQVLWVEIKDPKEGETSNP